MMNTFVSLIDSTGTCRSRHEKGHGLLTMFSSALPIPLVVSVYALVVLATILVMQPWAAFDCAQILPAMENAFSATMQM